MWKFWSENETENEAYTYLDINDYMEFNDVYDGDTIFGRNLDTNETDEFVVTEELEFIMEC